ncbi:hypothetical protein [Wolbachia endosymbiont (group A) of Scambus nigricans]|uniref:hypothetical protein n=1 Tax=Wolbachia endosymbiont (group A) of Scambus nigricans TaxID=2954055 RepID=UPI0022312123|nr:hypothetical protein [Wolbachia endosymbiont (group A) of Scambus nigricans]
MLLACYSHKHISYRIRTIIRKAIILMMRKNKLMLNLLNMYQKKVQNLRHSLLILKSNKKFLRLQFQNKRMILKV